MSKLTALAMSAALLGATPAGADTVREATMVGEVQQFTANGKVEACGVTISAIELAKTLPKQDDTFLAFNGSFMLYSTDGGIVKARASEARGADMLAGKLALRPLEAVTFWLKARGKPATTPAPGRQIQTSDDPGYRLYVTEFEPLSGLIEAVLAEEPIQVGVRLQGSNYANVLFGVIKMSDSEHEQFAACLGEWAQHHGDSDTPTRR